MSKWKCRIIIEDEVEADTKLEAQQVFLRTATELGASWYCVPGDVDAKEILKT